MSFFCTGLLIVSACFWLMYGTSAFASPLEQSVESSLKAGEITVGEGRYNEALQQFTQSLEQFPTIGYGNRCLAHLQIQHYSTDNLPTDEHSTAQANIYRDRGASYLVLANYVAAVADFNAAISRNRDDLWTYFNRGCAYHRSNNFLPALQDFNWVIARDDRHAHAYFNRGIIYARLGQADAAIKNLEQALQRFPANAHATNVVIPTHQAQHLIEQLKLGQTDSAIFSILSDHAVSS